MNSFFNRRGIVASVAVVAAVALCVTSASAASAATASSVAARPWLNKTLSTTSRVDVLLDRMTLDQKVALLIQTGGQGVPELGIPAIRGRDASNGISPGIDSTALPAGLALASTFDDTLAKAYGAVAGKETRAAGYNSAAAPSVDLARNPWNGRQWEDAGEDPLLTGRTGTAEVEGIQSQDIPAEVKHYALYNQETRRAHVNSVADERTIQEVYLRPWAKLVSQAQPGSIMCSFNKINGDFGCGSGTLLTNILKNQLGFKGFVQSDFNAAHTFADYVAGMDTSGEQLTFSGDNLKQAVTNGTVPEARLTDAVRRVLWSMFEYGIIDNPPAGSFDNPQPSVAALPQSMLKADAKVAETVGAAGTVLLKNSSSQLPLASGTKSVAVIGSDVDHYIDGGGSASVALPADLTTILDGITERAGTATTVSTTPGTDPVGLGDTLPGPAPIPSSVLRNVKAAYFSGINNTSGDAVTYRSEKNVNLRTGLSADAANTSQVAGLPLQLVVAPMTAQYTGTLSAPSTGTYQLSLTHLGTARLYLDNQLVLENSDSTFGTQSVSVPLTADNPVSVRVTYTTDAPNQFDGSLNDQAGAMIRLGWTPPTDVQSPAIEKAVALAKKSSVAVVVARDYTGEAADRGSLTLPEDQDRLISAVAAANPHTIVVLATSGAVLMPWLSKVSAVMETWYGGQAQGKSVASILWGDTNPSGRLPITFPASETQPTLIGVSNSFNQINEVGPTTTYSDGVNVGYRGYAAKKLKPLFPFGYGLSYSRFDYSKLSMSTATATAMMTNTSTSSYKMGARVAAYVTNTSKIAGTETVQVYVGQLPTALATTPVKALAGYAKVTLQPGKTAKVTIELDDRSLQYWSTSKHAWVTPKGMVPFFVGSASNSARLAGNIMVK